MKEKQILVRMSHIIALAVALAVVYCALGDRAAAQSTGDSRGSSQTVIVHPQFGGTILGFGIDQGGTEGLLSEYVSESGGENLVATEAFSQQTGAIVKVIAMQNHTMNDYDTQGVFGNHVGLVLYQVGVNGGFENFFLTLNPLNNNVFSGRWTPPIQSGYQLWGMSLNQGDPELAVLQRSTGSGPYMYLNTSNVAANSFGPLVPYNDPNIGCCPVLAYDFKTNEAMLAGDNGSPTSAPILATINLLTRRVQETNGVGVGNPNGMAIDPVTDTAVITTPGGPLIPPMVEFFNLDTQTGSGQLLPGTNVGGDVEFDPVHSLFIVAAGDGTNNSIFEYEPNGTLEQTITGGSLNTLFSCCALNPSTRTGFGFGDRLGESLQSFSY
jgi:hypothetical protein